VLAAGGPVLCEVVTNVLWGLARIAAGEPSITPALIDRLWDERRGLFLDTARGEVARVDDTDLAGGDRRIRVSTWSALAPLALPDLPEEIARRLVEEHLLDQRKYWLPYPPTSVSAQERSFEPRKWKAPLRRLYWRGPTWINSAWLIWIGLLRQGYDPEALEMAKRLSGAVVRERLREFYEPYTGEGLGAREFGWSSLIAELVEPDPSAARSYLD
jgi:glycogen debranching enzyme